MCVYAVVNVLEDTLILVPADTEVVASYVEIIPAELRLYYITAFPASV